MYIVSRSSSSRSYKERCLRTQTVLHGAPRTSTSMFASISRRIRPISPAKRYANRAPLFSPFSSPISTATNLYHSNIAGKTDKHQHQHNRPPRRKSTTTSTATNTTTTSATTSRLTADRTSGRIGTHLSGLPAASLSGHDDDLRVSHGADDVIPHFVGRELGPLRQHVLVRPARC